jgi:hypothetical protein
MTDRHGSRPARWDTVTQVSIGIVTDAAMTPRLTDAETQALRAQAEIEHRSMQDVAWAAVREYVQRRCAAAQVDDALHVLIPCYTGLLGRPGTA